MARPHTGAPALVVERLLEQARPLHGAMSDYDPIVDRAQDREVVLIGEASHGTHEFYEVRAQITRRLVLEHGFNAVAVEADWPDAYRVNRYVRGQEGDRSASAALDGFRRFPRWMWRNTVVRESVEWLRELNQLRPPGDRVGFYGLDLYSLFASVKVVLDYLDRVDPAAAERARRRYACFDHFAHDLAEEHRGQAYGYAASLELTESCEQAVMAQLREMQERTVAAQLAEVRDGRDGDEVEARFCVEQNARVVENAERYYRTMFRGEVSSWNLRDTHMAEALTTLRDHLLRRTGRAKVVVWAHNSHLGDARATEMGERGELNLGQLVREAHGDRAMAIGLSTYSGTVTAAREWGGEPERMQIRPGLPGSWEALLHATGLPRALLLTDGDAARLPRGLGAALQGSRLERAIGVIYRPLTERQSHYFYARLADQFDAVLHLDETQALVPLPGGPPSGLELEPPETYPVGV